MTLGIQTVIDLRYAWEIAADGRLPDVPGIEYHNLSIEHRPYDQAGLGESTDPVPFLADRYAEVAADGVNELGRALEVIAAPGSTPVIVHCTSGKDRTGLLIALVLSLLGVSDDDIVTDFALTGLATDRLRGAWETKHPDRELIWPGNGQAPPELMRRVLGELERRYGSPRDYARNELGASDELLQALKDRLLVAGSPPEQPKLGEA